MNKSDGLRSVLSRLTPGGGNKSIFFMKMKMFVSIIIIVVDALNI